MPTQSRPDFRDVLECIDKASRSLNDYRNYDNGQQDKLITDATNDLDRIGRGVSFLRDHSYYLNESVVRRVYALTTCLTDWQKKGIALQLLHADLNDVNRAYDRLKDAMSYVLVGTAEAEGGRSRTTDVETLWSADAEFQRTFQTELKLRRRIQQKVGIQPKRYIIDPEEIQFILGDFTFPVDVVEQTDSDCGSEDDSIPGGGRSTQTGSSRSGHRRRRSTNSSVSAGSQQGRQKIRDRKDSLFTASTGSQDRAGSSTLASDASQFSIRPKTNRGKTNKGKARFAEDLTEERTNSGEAESPYAASSTTSYRTETNAIAQENVAKSSVQVNGNNGTVQLDRSQTDRPPARSDGNQARGQSSGGKRHRPHRGRSS